MLYIHTKFYMPSSNGPLVMAVKLKVKDSFAHKDDSLLGYNAV
jgi:hypothetical protein